MVHGYKVFNHNWTCRGKQYTCPGEFEENVILKLCERGIHFCERAIDCFNYYDFNPDNHVAEVVAYGEIVGDGNKKCTNKLRIVREIPWEEVLRIVNTGKNCTGMGNTGDWNTGDWNTGDWNTGDWNTTSFSSGCFNTIEQPILIFNKASDWTYDDWLRSNARRILSNIEINRTSIMLVCESDMTEEEKAVHPEYKTTGGYLKRIEIKGNVQEVWDGLTDEEKQCIYDLPNFDAVIFKECTGIEVGR